MNKPLDEQLSERILATVNEGYELETSGDKEQAEAMYLEGWNMLPMPRHAWDVSRSVARAIVRFYYRMERFDEAKKWLAQSFTCHIPAKDTSMDVLAGKVYFDSGDMEKAREHFLRAYERGKRRAFSEEAPKYLQFCLEQVNGGSK